MDQAERSAIAFSEMARDGVRLDDDTIHRIAAANARQGRSSRWALWIAALAVVVAAWAIVAGRI